MTKTRLSLASAPLLPLTVAFFVGILFGPLSFSLWLAGGLAVAGGGLFLSGRNYASIISAALATGIIVSVLGRPVSAPSEIMGKEVSVAGTVVEMREGEATRNLIVRVDSIDSYRIRSFKLFAVCLNFNPEIYAADHIRFTATLTELDTETDLPLELNYGEYLYNQGVTASAFIPKGSDITALYPATGIRNTLLRIKDGIINRFAMSDLSQASKTFLITVLTGDSSYLLPDDREAYSRSGVAHVLALSGLHVAIITMVISLTLFPLTLLRLNKLKGVITVLALWIFALMTGLTPSVTRSVIMATVFLLTLITERRPAPVNSLCFAALCILVAVPLAIYSISFQLSFSAILFILIFADKLNPVSKRNRPWYQIAGWITTTFAAAMGTGVISSVYFHVFPIYFLIVNIPFTIMLPFILGGGILFAVLSVFGCQPHWLTGILDFMCGILSRITGFVSHLPGAYIDNIFVSADRLIVFSVAMCAIAAMLYFPGRKTVTVAVSLTLAVIVYATFIPATVEDTSIYIPRYRRYSVVLIPRRPVIHVYTSALKADIPELTETVRRRYGNYMLSRGIDSISVARVSDEVVSVGKTNLIFSKSIPLTLPDGRNLLILTRGFRPEAIADTTVLPDTVYISPCMNQKIANRAKDSLEAHGYMVVDLKKTKVRI